MTSSVSRGAGRSPITIAAGFLGAFVVGSLAVQLVRTQSTVRSTPSVSVEPVIAGQAALWSVLGDRDLTSSGSTVADTPAIPNSVVEPVIASPATLWSTLGER